MAHIIKSLDELKHRINDGMSFNGTIFVPSGECLVASKESNSHLHTVDSVYQGFQKMVTAYSGQSKKEHALYHHEIPVIMTRKGFNGREARLRLIDVIDEKDVDELIVPNARIKDGGLRVPLAKEYTMQELVIRAGKMLEYFLQPRDSIENYLSPSRVSREIQQEYIIAISPDIKRILRI